MSCLCSTTNNKFNYVTKHIINMLHKKNYLQNHKILEIFNGLKMVYMDEFNQD